MRHLLLALFLLAGCEPSDTPSSPDVIDDDMYDSSGTIYYIETSEVPEVEQAAMSGDNQQLQRLIDYYMFSHIPQDAKATSTLQKWQLLGAERGLEGAAHNLVLSSSKGAGPDCSTLRVHARSLQTEDLNSIRKANAYVEECLAN